MSKIGRKSIPLGSVEINVAGSEIHYKGKKASGVYVIPASFKVEIKDKEVSLVPVKADEKDNSSWGLHRALLANKIKGADVGFERRLKIVGLGFKAVLSGNKIQLTLGFSHKVEDVLPEGVSAEVDKTGQLLTLRSADKELLGALCSELRAKCPPEPYKGVGIRYENEVVRHKAGKTK